MTAEERATAIADKIVPAYRAKGSRYNCTGTIAKMWNAAYEGAHSALASPVAQADGEDVGTLERIRGVTAQYREAPFRSADWLAGEVMRILDTVPANDAATPKAPATDAGEVGVPCDTCQGNGEIVTDWREYMHPTSTHATGDEGTADCPDCDGTGRVAATPPAPNDDLRAALQMIANGHGCPMALAQDTLDRAALKENRRG